MSTPSLIASLAVTGERPNVRLMEELLARGPDWEPGIVAALNLAVAASADDPRPNPVWLAVVAGVMRLSTAVPALLRMLRASPRHESIAPLAAAEALSKIGEPAVDGVAEVARDRDWWHRIWAYASLGWNADLRAAEILKAALAEEVLLADGVSLGDVVVKALADRGDISATPALLEALRACEPDMRGEIEDAIRDLHAGDPHRLIDRDWRLRYLMDPTHGFVDAGWPASAIGFTEDDGRRPRLAGPAPSIRTLGEILARRRPTFGVRDDPDGNPLCRCCDAPMWLGTGVWVCPASAVTVAWIQDWWLTRARDELRLDDLFDVFEILEGEYHALLEGPRPEGSWDQDEVDPHTAVVWAWRGIEWLVEQGIEDVWTAGERIRKEASKLEGLHVLAKGTRGAGGGPSVN